MVVRVSGGIVIGALFLLVAVLVGVNQWRMVVLMAVIVRTVLELAQDTAAMMVRNVIVVVRVD
jgi:hypothetical protein